MKLTDGPRSLTLTLALTPTLTPTFTLTLAPTRVLQRRRQVPEARGQHRQGRARADGAVLPQPAVGRQAGRKLAAAHPVGARGPVPRRRSHRHVLGRSDAA